MKNFGIGRLLVGLLLILSVQELLAGKPKKLSPQPIEYHDTVITSANATSIVVTQDKVARTFAITPATEITFKGQRAVVTDLQPGMAVSITMGTSAETAARISANVAPVHPAAPGKK